MSGVKITLLLLLLNCMTYTSLACAMCIIYSNWGTEKEEGEPYHNGNSDPRGFGKLYCICVVWICSWYMGQYNMLQLGKCHLKQGLFKYFQIGVQQNRDNR